MAMTYVDALNVAIDALDGEVAEKLTALREQYAKKRTSVNSKAKAEADARAEKVYNALAEMDKPVTVTELIALTSDEDVAGYTNQRVSALMRKLGNRVVKEVVKGKSYFTVA